MNSKNNHHRPKAEREYFDKPYSYMHQGFAFSPIHKRPVELVANHSRSKSTNEGFGSTMKASASKNHLSTFGTTFYQVKNPTVLPVTNGLNDEQLV